MVSLARFAAAGLAWGCVAWLLGYRAVGPQIMVGVAASPLIGVAAGVAFQERFASAGWGGRWLFSLLSLYLGATLFGMALGIRDLLVSGTTGPETLWEHVAGIWYGTALFVIALWPMAFLTHLALSADFPWWKRP